MKKKGFRLTKRKGIIISVPLIALTLCIIGYYAFTDNKFVNTNPNNEKIEMDYKWIKGLLKPLF